MSKFRIGDIVRLSGPFWPRDIADTEQVISGFSNGDPVIFADGFEWLILEGTWEATLVERPDTYGNARQDLAEALWAVIHTFTTAIGVKRLVEWLARKVKP